MPTPPKPDASPGLGKQSNEPDLSFLTRTPRERKEIDNLLSANDRRGGLAADDLRKSLEADRANVKSTVVKKQAPAAQRRIDSDTDVPAREPEQVTPTTKTEQQSRERTRPERPRARRDDQNSLFVGSAIRIADGRITSCDSLIVDGHMEANLDGARVLEITETGTFLGSARVDHATIDGVFEGELTVSGRLVITASGRVSGKIRYARIEIEPGGVVLGDLGSLPDH